MAFGLKKKALEEAPEEDMTAWILENAFAEFVLMHTPEIKYMCMLGYTYFHGSKVFNKISSKAPFSYRIVSMIMACTGGGILVPIFINAVPIPLAQDSYPIIIFISFMLHTYFPILREVLDLSNVFKAAVVFLYEVLRAFVVVKLTHASGKAIPSSEFAFPLFGPIFCGTIAGCGGAFLPLNKGLDPIKKNGLAPPMLSAFLGALFYHLSVNLAPENFVDVPKKAHVMVAAGFVLYSFYNHGIMSLPKSKGAAKEETIKKMK